MDRHKSYIEYYFSEEIKDELKSRGLLPYVLPEQSHSTTIVLEVYQNERWAPLLKSWGSIIGIHTNAMFDRAAYSDRTGNHPLL
jgi:hypothetical protein